MGFNPVTLNPPTLANNYSCSGTDKGIVNQMAWS